MKAPCSSPTWPGACRSSASSRRSISSSTTSRPRRKAARSDSPRRRRTPNCWSGTASSHSNRRSRRRANSQSPSLNVPGALEVAGVELPFVIPQGELNLRGSYSVALDEPMQLDVHLPQMQLNGLTRARAGSRAGLRHGSDHRHQRHEDRDAGQYRVARHDRGRRRQGRRLDDAGRHAEHRSTVRRSSLPRGRARCAGTPPVATATTAARRSLPRPQHPGP